MKPLGHDTARMERDDRIVPLDARLDEAWSQYRAEEIHPTSGVDEFHRAMRILEPLQPSLPQLHAFLLRASLEKKTMEFTLGCFVSAGYQLLPEKEIVYDLDTPELNCLGFLLSGKRLIIDGRVNEDTGNHMVGELVVNGVVGPCAGFKMIGNLTVHGHAESDAGEKMIGEFRSRIYCVPSMIGRANGVWTRGASRWTPDRWTKKRFFDDIAHPCHTSRFLLYEHLTTVYGGEE
jgi:hypothetical protein